MDPDELKRVAVLEGECDRARASIGRGLVRLLVSSGFAVGTIGAWLVLGSVKALVVGSIVGGACGVQGAWLVARGFRDHRRAARELDLFDEARQLPEARLLPPREHEDG
jgi:hypothetical protein